MSVVRLRSGIRVKTATGVVPEWALQASAVRSLRALPEFDRDFTLAADMNAGKRGIVQAVKDKATGLTPGECDLRVYLRYGRLCMIEYKTEKGRLSPAQKARHALLRGLGFTIEVLHASTEAEAAERTVALVRGWLAANDNNGESE